MGKKVRKKSGAPRGKAVADRTKSDPIQTNGTVVDVPESVKERKLCSHVEKSVDLEKLSAKISSSEHIKCEHCKQGVNERKVGKGNKGKLAKKKGTESKAIWLCLECGYFACGGVGLPTGAQSHIVGHVRQTKHRLVIQWENPQLRWCYTCSSLLPVEKSDESNDVLAEIVKLIKDRIAKPSATNVEEVWFGSGSVLTKIKSESTALSDITATDGYVVRGLVNLGNTCFFNSITQNLLALDVLRGYFLDEDASAGPLTLALKKLYTETKLEAGSKNVVNPRSFFGCVCSKAPQFRGYQQHDSHELLRCLLDGLSAEEISSRKKQNADERNGNPSSQSPTFVDIIFGGQISSTLSCVQCNHSSTVYEPFLDLSLPVPTKKPPPKRPQVVSRTKKAKLPPKKVGKFRSKNNKDVDSCVSGSVATTTTGDGNRPISENSQAVNEKAFEGTKEQIADVEDSCSWLDYCEPATMSNENDPTLQTNDFSISSNNEDGSMHVESSQGCLVGGEPSSKDESSTLNLCEEELPLMVEDSQVILLPCPEEISTTHEIVAGGAESSSASGCGQDNEFDGFVDLFNEPETVEGPVFGPSLPPEVGFTGIIASKSSDSDPDEVDDTNSPVSVESCLAHFVKTELLSNDNAWACENCSKTFQQEKLEAKRKAKLASTISNGDDTHSEATSVKGILNSPEVGKLSNGDMKNDAETLVSHNEKADYFQTCSNDENGQTIELGPCKQVKTEMEDEFSMRSSASSSPKVLGDSCNSANSTVCEKPIVSVQQNDSDLRENCKSDESEDEEMSSKCVIVKRDAIKKVLINKAPSILTLHLKRFSQDTRGRLSKLNGHVSFQEYINLGPYLDPRCTNGEKFIYRLVGVVEHSGTMRGGHYVAYVRGEKKKEKEGAWYHISDAYVRQISLESVLKCEAYILFYERMQAG